MPRLQKQPKYIHSQLKNPHMTKTKDFGDATLKAALHTYLKTSVTLVWLQQRQNDLNTVHLLLRHKSALSHSSKDHKLIVVLKPGPFWWSGLMHKSRQAASFQSFFIHFDSEKMATLVPDQQESVLCPGFYKYEYILLPYKQTLKNMFR